MWLTLLIIHLVIMIFILIMFYYIYKRRIPRAEREEPERLFMIKLNKIKERLEKLRYNGG